MRRPAVQRVLVVEDSVDSRETLRLLLDAWGHVVQVAADGEEGLRQALAWRPDVAVLDIGLPRLDGYQLAQRVRAALGSSVRLIALTAYTQPDDRRRALEAGFDHFLTKPADPEELHGLVNAAAPTE